MLIEAFSNMVRGMVRNRSVRYSGRRTNKRGEENVYD